MKEAVRDFLRDDEGLTMVEYAIAGALVAAAGAAAFTTLGSDIAIGINNLANLVLGA